MNILRDSAVLLLFAALLLTVSLTSMRQKSLTVDELAHLPAGYTYVTLGDFRLNSEHPPLVKALAGLPLSFLHPHADLNDDTWKKANQYRFGAKFFHQWNGDADRLLFWGRFPVVLLTLLLGVAVYFCARDFYGRKAGCVALALYLLTPDLIAHGQLVTTDLGIAAFMFIACYFFYRAPRRATVWNVLASCLAVGLAVITKFSSALLFPMLALVGAAFAYSRTPVTLALGKFSGRQLKEKRPKLLAAALIAATVVAGFFIIWASYGFRHAISTDPEIAGRLTWSRYTQQPPGAVMSAVLLARDLRLLPESYTFGLGHMLHFSQRRAAFLHGGQSSTGFWYYFVVTFLIKTPLPLLLFILLGFVLLRRYGAGLAAEAMLLLPPGFYFLYSLTAGLNIGNRHILPVYPFLIVFASKAARVFDELSPARDGGEAKKVAAAGWRRQLTSSRSLAMACAALLAWQAAATGFIYPHFLSYFNELVGGPTNGHRWLVDSNLDWGQDLKGLAKFRAQHPDEPLYLCYFGSASPDAYNLQAKLLPGWPSWRAAEFKGPDYARFDDIPAGALVAVSATYLQGVYLNESVAPGMTRFLDRLRGMEPVGHVGYSIFIYRW
jgi:4-amino-4-deoxy-L-arabinose transferase-like glycosyltransferase